MGWRLVLSDLVISKVLSRWPRSLVLGSPGGWFDEVFCTRWWYLDIWKGKK